MTVPRTPALPTQPAQKPRRAGLWRGLAPLALAAACLLGAAGPSDAQTTAKTMPGEVLVVLHSSDAITPLLTRYGLSVTGRFGTRPIFRLRLVNGADVQPVISALLAEPAVVTAETNHIGNSPESVKNKVWAAGTAQDYAAQWAGQAIGLAAAQRLASGAGVRVAVLDTGFDLQHPALAGRLLPGWDFVDGDADPSDTALPIQGGYGHGTHVAGLVAWVAPGALIMPLRVLDSEGQGNAWVLAEAMLHAIDPDHNPATADGAQVINLSLAGADRTNLMATIGSLVSCSTPDTPVALIDLSDAGYNDDRQRCAAQGGAVVAAGAGNDGSSVLKTYPAAESAYGLIAVAASASNGSLAGFSNSGTWIELAAPGDGITSSVPGGGYATWAGTSMATPLVAGTAALVRQRFPRLSAKDVARCLDDSTSPLAGTSLRQLNAGRALHLLSLSTKLCR